MQLAFVRRAQPVLHAHQRFQRLPSDAGPASSPPGSDADPSAPSARPAPAPTPRAASASTNAACSGLAPCNRSITPLTSGAVNVARRASAKSASWLPAGNRVNCRASDGPTKPKRKSSFTATLNFSNNASRRHTQLLCRPSKCAASTCVMPSSRTRPCTTHASSNSRTGRWSRFRPRIAAFAVGSSTSSTRTLRLVNSRICRAAAKRLKPSSSSSCLVTHARHHRRQLAPTPQRSRHRLLRFGIGQAITPITLPQSVERHRPHHAIVPTHARTLHAPKYRRRETGDAKSLSRRPLPPPLRVEELYPGLTQKKICKDMLTRCPAAALASSRAHNACADAAPDSAIPDPARDAKPSGTPHCKNACSNVHAEA